MSSIEALGNLAADVAMRAAVTYIKNAGIDPKDLNLQVLSDALRETVALAVPEALTDAKEAFEANMPGVAQATFVASLSLAGVKAAKAVIG